MLTFRHDGRGRVVGERGGFTLIELLVVISIIALLIGILLPALGLARKAAKDAVCSSNVRQLSIGVFAYGVDNREVIPAPERPLPPFGIQKLLWHVAIWSHVTGSPLANANYAPPHDYLADTAFECPLADRQPSGYSQTDHTRNSYGLNNGVAPIHGDLAGTPEARAGQPKRMDAIENPAATLMLADATRSALEYFDRGREQNAMGMLSDIGGMLSAKGRHGKQTFEVRWNIAHFDGSTRLAPFDSVPGTPEQYYIASQRLTPAAMLAAPDVPRLTKLYWVGKASP